MQKALKWQLNIFDLTFPQVVIRGRYVGGADDLLQVVEDDRFSRIIQDPVTHCRENGVISWDEDLLSVASRPDLFKVPRVRGEGVWYPNWPYYVFQWTVHANLIRYISVLQVSLSRRLLRFSKLERQTHAILAQCIRQKTYVEGRKLFTHKCSSSNQVSYLLLRFD